MQVVMNETKRAARDGEIYPSFFKKDEEYDLEGDILATFLRNNWATPIDPELTAKTDVSTLTRKELLAFAEEHELEVNIHQKVEELRAEIKEKLNG